MTTRTHALSAATAVAGAAVLLLAACSKDVPALSFGSAQPSGNRLAAQPPTGRSLALAQWPHGCEVLSDAEIKAILPQAGGIKRKPVKVTIIDFNPLSEADPGTTGDVPDAGCKFSFGLPDKHENDSNSSITLTFTAVADPALVAKSYTKDLAQAREDATKYHKEFEDLGTSLGPQGCFAGDLARGNLTCHQGPYEFEVSGTSTADGVGEYPKADRNWSDKVLRQVARTLSARMP
ncbi:hypothetical protein BX285_6947 [Streptomyces sp. 1114.5]|uniref:hypothetical protein n=1 Tax=unclassified Streptomyces TaxID=2593676 RepID=UPI000BC95B9C|nr:MULTISPECIES: hypothetical protein [unclassified Streptomyces]RKT09838.1 hypothetical protein BX285_6947 [Streptomyces sp. 1114.5]SOB88812.1 hypothetical protein SAMN06272789_7126 [Streptomyces sp. 1331.2]